MGKVRFREGLNDLSKITELVNGEPRITPGRLAPQSLPLVRDMKVTLQECPLALLLLGYLSCFCQDLA